MKKIFDLKNKSWFNKFATIFRIISAIIILVCIIQLILWFTENIANKNIQSELIKNIKVVQSESSDDVEIIKDLGNISSSKINKIDLNLSDLKSKNPDTVGWIKINDTVIDYPIVQTNNNTYYLNHNFKKKYNSAGWIFADYRNNFKSLDQNTIIYGHNRRNGIMFNDLRDYYNKDLTSNKYITFKAQDNNYIGEIFSVYREKEKNINIPISFDTEDEFDTYIDNLINKSKYDFKTNVDTNHKILTLCTCDNNSTYRILLHAKLVQVY